MSDGFNVSYGLGGGGGGGTGIAWGGGGAGGSISTGDTITLAPPITPTLTPGTTRLSFPDAGWEMRSDGRTVHGRIVPYGEVVDAIEGGRRIKEQFLPRSLTRLCQVVQKRGNAAWISFNLDHDESLDARIGYASMVEEASDGAYADFRLLPGRDLDKVRAMLTESHTGLSVMFDDVVPFRTIDGVRSRVQVNISHVAATPWGVYPSAKIMAMRDAPSGAPAPTLDEIDDRPALREWQQYLETLNPST